MSRTSSSPPDLVSRHNLLVSDADDGVLALPTVASDGPVSLAGWQVSFLLRAYPSAPAQTVSAWVSGDQVHVDTTGSSSWPRSAVWELLVQPPGGGTQQVGHGGVRRSRQGMPPAPAESPARPAAMGEPVTVGAPARGAALAPSAAVAGYRAEAPDPGAAQRLVARRSRRAPRDTTDGEVAVSAASPQETARRLAARRAERTR